MASASFSITINPVSGGEGLGLSLLPGATVGVPYNATIGVSGGTAPYACVQTGGSLPAGLTLSSSCVVSGTPTTAGTSTMIVMATDSGSPALTITGPESITVSAAGSLTLSSPPNGIVGTPYSGAIGVGAGIAPYSCAIVSGSLPAGLTLTLSTLPGATVGVPYTATIGVSGGTSPYTCLQTGGTLPAGLSLSASCVVSGTPTTAGTSTLQVKATDASSPAETVNGPESITVAPAGSLTLSSPPSGTVGTPYSGTIGVAGGTTPYTCLITAGSLP